MKALILPKPDFETTLRRDVARIGGTIIGARLATLLAALTRPHAWTLIVLVIVYIWAAYALQNVNCAAYILVLTGYIAFELAIGSQPETLTAWHRVLATNIGGAIAIAAYLIHINAMRFWRWREASA